MAPYKDPEQQRTFQNLWIKQRRADFLRAQHCALCGAPGDHVQLRIFRHVGAPRLSWSKKGPSHKRFRVVCADGTGCLVRRGNHAALPAEPRPRPPRPAPRARAPAPAKPRRRPSRPAGRPPAAKPVPEPRPLPRPPVPVPPVPPVPRPEPPPRRRTKTTKRLEEELAQPDVRPVCPVHGPRGTMRLWGQLKFVCCGRLVPEPARTPRVV